MGDRKYTEEEIARCREAMSKKGPQEALRLIASGRVIIDLTADGRDIYVESFDGRKVRDPDFPDRRMTMAGGWPLFIAGMIDEFGIITAAGRKALAEGEVR